MPRKKQKQKKNYKSNKKKTKKIVWKFTNKRKLTSPEFTRYFEKKVKSTIRKYNMPLSLLRKKTLKAEAINHIIRKLHLLKLSKRKGKLSDKSLNDISNTILYTVMYKKINELSKLLPKNQPLYFLSDKEIKLYAKLKKIKNTEKIQNKPKKKDKNKLKPIDFFIKEIEKQSPDIRHNIVESLLRTFN